MPSRSDLRIDLRRRRVERSKIDDFWIVCPTEARGRLQDELARASLIGLYRAVGSEVNPKDIYRICSDKDLALPRVDGRDTTMTFRRWSICEALEKAEFGFEQPQESAAIVEPDVVIVPLLGFDARLNRLGQGAGHYDRYFAAHTKPRKIGLAWTCQQVEALPVEAWDVPLDAILTEKGWIAAA